MKAIQVALLTPNGSVYEGEAETIRVPGIMGSFAVLTGHAPIISPLEKGEVLITLPDRTTQSYQIDGGVIEVLDDHVSVLVESIIK
jgi:F-type H+-transporting ATPase subunit epsilon